MFFIHGGALEAGDASMCPPGFLLEKDVVLVSIQYRLGPLGFLATVDEIAGNMGFQDTILALHWTKTYIHHFGGDPNQITIFGVSAGSLLVSALVLSPEVPDSLFQRAIMQSGSYFGTWGYESNPLEAAKELIKFSDCDPTDDILEMNQCLKNLPTHKLLLAYKKLMVSKR